MTAGPGDENPRRRASDRSLLRQLIRQNWYRDVWLLVITVLLAIFAHSLSQSTESRRDQTCQLFERQALDAVSQLVATYRYVQTLTAKEAREPLNRAVLLQLPDVERHARAVQAPHYCDSSNVGLPDPRPVLPHRPPGLLPLR